MNESPTNLSQDGDNQVATTFLRLPEWVNNDAALVRRGRGCSATFLLGAGSVPLYVTVAEGNIVDITRGPVLMRSWRFAIRANAEAWHRFWQPIPAPGYNDLFAMSRFGHATIEGDLQPLMANLRYVKEVLAAPRRAMSEAVLRPSA
ncbi:MAG: hypothetical protein ACKVQK_15415 [Burkholderiales bacterium]